MNSWTNWTSGTVITLPQAPEGATLAEAKGESQKVYEIAGRTGWLAKLYKQPLTAPEEDRLESLIALPSGMPGSDVALLDQRTSWPVARIVDAGRTVGVVMARAPANFFAVIRRRSGGVPPPEPLPLDWLVMNSASIEKRGLRVPDAATRARAVWELLRIGALFERHHVVYADWSYSNALWNQDTGEVFVIDMDTCGIHHREWIESPGGEDPLFKDGSRALTTYSDRYKVAQLTVRCLTGYRDDPYEAYCQLETSVQQSDFGKELKRVLTATDATDRPGLSDLLTAFEASCVPQPRPTADGANVTGKVRLRGRGSRGRDNQPPDGIRDDDGRRAASTPLSTPGAANVTGWVPLRDRPRSSSGTPPTTGSRPRSTAPPRATPGPTSHPTEPQAPKATHTPPPRPATPPVWPTASATHSTAPSRGGRAGQVARKVAALLVAAYVIAHFLLGWL